MNLAIIITVSEYLKPENNLPASKKDGEIVYNLLKGINKYDTILKLTDNEKSLDIKEQISNLIIANRSEDIEELFFYYSGHGEFSQDEFYYLLSDFDFKKRNQTCLQNSEVDDLIRNLNPNLVVKVVDACQSGTTYIKEQDVLTKYFNESKKSFNKCYFLNSSLNNQASYQDENLSFFTHSFLHAIKNHPTGEIRYKDIIDYILDDFQDNDFQTPFFVLQAELTEKFCQINEDLRKSLVINSQPTTSSSQNNEKSKTLFDYVVQDSKNYVDKEGAILAMNFCKEEILNIKLDYELEKLFDLKINFIEDNNQLKGAKIIGKWLKDNKNDFFANPYYKTEYDFMGQAEGESLEGYTLLIESPFKAVSIEIISKYPNIKSYQSNIAFLLSKKLITIFYNILDYKETDWDSKVLDISDIKWKYSNAEISSNDSIKKYIDLVVEYINDKIKTDINIQFGLQNDDDDDDNDDDLPF